MERRDSSGFRATSMTRSSDWKITINCCFGERNDAKTKTSTNSLLCSCDVGANQLRLKNCKQNNCFVSVELNGIVPKAVASQVQDPNSNCGSVENLISNASPVLRV